MKIFRFVKKVFFIGLTILSNFTKAISIKLYLNEESRMQNKITSY